MGKKTGTTWREARSSERRERFPVRSIRTLYYTVAMPLSSDLSFTDSLTNAQRTRFYEQHKPIAVVMILVVFLFPFIGLFTKGLLGVVLGVILSVLAYYLTPYVVHTIFDEKTR